MKLSLSIICDELAHARPDLLPQPLVRYRRPRSSHTVRLTPERLMMRGVRIFDGTVDADGFAPDLLYIAKSGQLDGGNQPRANILCIGAPPHESTRKGGFRIVEIAENADPLDVLEAVLAIFERYGTWRDEYTRAIMDRIPLEDLLAVGCSLFRNPVSLASPSLENLALAGARLPHTIRGSIWETILEKGYSPLEAIEKDELDQLITEIENWNLPRLSKPQRAYSDNCFLIAPVNDGSRYSPALASSDICEPFTDGQVDLIALIAADLETYLRLTNATGHAFTELALIAETLFKGTPVDSRRMEHALKRHQWHADDDFALVCVLNGETALIDAIGVHAINAAPEALAVHFEDQLALIIDCTRTDSETSLTALDELLATMGLGGGVSYTTSGFVNIRRALDQARIAASVATMQTTAGLMRFDSNYMRCIVRMLSQQAPRQSLVHPAILALAELDKGAVLIDTLACYLRHDGNALRTAQKLFVHRSTLAYRLNRIESITGLSLKELSDDESLTLLISCLIVRD